MKINPWQWSLRKRLLWAMVFFRPGRYAFSDIVQNIVDSDRIRHEELTEATICNDRFEVLQHAIAHLGAPHGVFAEFGVFEGKTLQHIAEHAPEDTPVYGFDSFEGLPDDWGVLLPKGEFATPVPSFPESLNISLEVGLIEDTLPPFLASNPNLKFSLIHIDCDLYNVTKFILTQLVSRLSDQSVIVFDEYYGYPTYEEHEYRAWREICDELRIASRPLAVSSHSAAFAVTKG